MTENAVKKIIEKFGGLSGLARALGHNNASTVQRWPRVGEIPRLQRVEVRKAAAKLGIIFTKAEERKLKS